jgi:hypothetical protein
MEIDDMKKIFYVLALILFLVSCGISESIKENGDAWDGNFFGSAENNIIGNFQYPENPAEQLKHAIENDINEHGLPMVIGNAERIVMENNEYTQINIYFTESNNEGVILFQNRNLYYDVEFSIDERDNPSFTIAFKDHENYQDMIMVLTLVFKYLSLDLSLEEAERLANLQDSTISTDGFSMPLDIGGYQVQSRYTNPHIFLHTPNFDSMLGVSVRALRQIWNGAIDASNFYELTSHEFYLLNLQYWDRERHPQVVFADFIARNTWHYHCWMRGMTWVWIDVDSMTGERFTVSLDTWARFLNPYEFGVGQRYTLFIDLQAYHGIIYAIQQSESTQFNSRGQAQPYDAPSMDFIDDVRIDSPNEEDTFVEVVFQTYAFGPLCIFLAVKGQPIGGETIWPQERYYPIREGYTFLGWFDNSDFLGEP